MLVWLLGMRRSRRGWFRAQAVAWAKAWRPNSSTEGPSRLEIQLFKLFPTSAERNCIDFPTLCRREREDEWPKSRNALRIIWEKQSLIERHYFYFIVKWMLIFFFFFLFSSQPWLPISFFWLFCLEKQNKTKQTRGVPPQTRNVFTSRNVFLFFFK